MPAPNDSATANEWSLTGRVFPRFHHSRFLAPLLLLLSLAACRTARTPDGLPANFGVVEEGRIYRGAQPDAENLRVLREKGIRTIVKLNRGDDFGELEEAARLGLRIVHVPLNSLTVGKPGSCQSVERAHAAMTDPSNWPVYVHCTHGRDRTGFLVGLFRERDEGWSVPQVLRELKAYGHAGLYRLLMPNISRSLEKGQVCAVPDR